MRLTAAIAAAILSATSTVAKTHTGAYYVTGQPDTKVHPISYSDASIGRMIRQKQLLKVSPGGSITLESGCTSCEISTHRDKTWDKNASTTSSDSNVVLVIPSDLACSGSMGNVQNICGFRCTGGGHTIYGAFELEGAIAKRAKANKNRKGKGKGKGKKKKANPDKGLKQLQGTPNEMAPPDVSTDDTDTDASPTSTPEAQNKFKRAPKKAGKKKGGAKKKGGKKKKANPDKGLTQLQGTPNEMAPPDVSADDTGTGTDTDTNDVQNKLLKRANKKKGKKGGKKKGKKKKANPDKGLTQLQGTPNEMAPPDLSTDDTGTGTDTDATEVQNKLLKRANKKKGKKGGKKKGKKKKANPDKGQAQNKLFKRANKKKGKKGAKKGKKKKANPDKGHDTDTDSAPEVQNKLLKRAKKKGKKGKKKGKKKANPDKGLTQLQGTPNEIAPPDDSEDDTDSDATANPTPETKLRFHRH
ncbi:hypothetical protein AA313_de0202341 [Arthrobotrys entomopaga]|nr:hypothetical protein AA313_de0202341 [Arthrobotrys entomopaga]